MSTNTKNPVFAYPVDPISHRPYNAIGKLKHGLSDQTFAMGASLNGPNVDHNVSSAARAALIEQLGNRLNGKLFYAVLNGLWRDYKKVSVNDF